MLAFIKSVILATYLSEPNAHIEKHAISVRINFNWRLNVDFRIAVHQQKAQNVMDVLIKYCSFILRNLKGKQQQYKIKSGNTGRATLVTTRCQSSMTVPYKCVYVNKLFPEKLEYLPKDFLP